MNKDKERVRCKCGGTFDKPGKMTQPNGKTEIQYRCNKCGHSSWMEQSQC